MHPDPHDFQWVVARRCLASRRTPRLADSGYGHSAASSDSGYERIVLVIELAPPLPSPYGLICATRLRRRRARYRLSEVVVVECPDAGSPSVVDMSSIAGPARGHTSKRLQRREMRGNHVVATASDNVSTTERHTAVVDIEDTVPLASDSGYFALRAAVVA
jgi:hypothetical protein